MIILAHIPHATELYDYPKMGIYRDTYFFTFNCFSSSGYTGASVLAINRQDMIDGVASPRAVEFRMDYPSPLPADVDSWDLPPATGPAGIILSEWYNLYMWKVYIDWSNPAAATMTGPQTIVPAAFNQLCPGASCDGGGGHSRTLASLAAFRACVLLFLCLFTHSITHKRTHRLRLHPAAGHHPDARRPLGPAHVPPGVPQLRLLRQHGRDALGQRGQRRVAGRAALVRDPQRGARHAVRLPAGQLRPRLQVPLDGQHRHGPGRQHGPR